MHESKSSEIKIGKKLARNWSNDTPKKQTGHNDAASLLLLFYILLNF